MKKKIEDYEATSTMEYLLTDLLDRFELTWNIQGNQIEIIPQETTKK